MQTHLDDQPIELAGDTLGQILEAANASVADRKRIIVEVIVDGQTLAGEALEQRLGDAAAGLDLRLISAPPGEVAAEALTAVREQLGEARVLQAEAADLLQRDRGGEALQKVGTAINAWLMTQQVVVHAANMLEVDLDQFEVDGQEVADAINDLAAQLKELRDLIQAGDMIALADVLAYEWPGLTDRWDALLVGLMDRAR